ncbi:hypothetical protein AB0I51_05465 [Streptomyces sp. NPDC050549]|uniref:hypothetical protein n=1 Tax=Streptomyces sp. NPDC050549 TaxID=3155406 RepID=UPI003431958D
MTNIGSDRTVTALRHRLLAVDAFNEAQAQYEIAVLDHVTALVVEAYPQTTHLTFDHSAHDRTIEPHALWATHHAGSEELVLDLRRATDTSTSALDLDELADGLNDALAGLHSAAWSAVRSEPRPDWRWVLDLPPADRAERIAELVRAHHPEARLITVEFVGDTCQVLAITSEDLSEPGGTITKPTPDDCGRRLWPEETERQIEALTLQIRALPHLRARHLMPVGGPAMREALLVLPQPGPDEK